MLKWSDKAGLISLFAVGDSRDSGRDSQRTTGGMGGTGKNEERSGGTQQFHFE